MLDYAIILREMTVKRYCKIVVAFALLLFLSSTCPWYFLSVGTCGDCLAGPPRWPSGKASASRAEGPGFEYCLGRDFFGVESYQ